MAWTRESLCLKWCVAEKAGVNQWPSSSMGDVEGGVLWLGVRQWSSSFLGTKKDTPMSRPLVDMVDKTSCRWRTLHL